MKLRDIATLRLRHQRIAGGKLRAPEDVVAWFGAVQSQEFAYAKWSLGKRLSDAHETAVDRAIDEGAILRTHVLRPTWHFLTAQDIRWILELTAPRVHASNASMYRKLELDHILPKTRDLFEAALAGGNHLTRRELQAVLHANGITAEGQRLAYIMMRAELDAVLCSGSPKGRQQTYALVAERAPAARSLPADEALAELTRRYFSSHGPATVRDYAWWSSLTLTQARRALEMLGSAVERLSVDGRTYLRIDTGIGGDEPSPTAHLMQGYDEYIVAYTESRDVLWAGGAIAAGPALRPPFTHALIVDGQLAGHWRRSPHPTRLIVETRLYGTLKAREKKAVDAAAERYSAFTGAAGHEVNYV